MVEDMVGILDQGALEGWGRGVGEALAGGGLEPPLVVALRGPLGAGKSVLARAVARGAGVGSSMPSPTYNLVFVYEAHGLTVHHLDLYRLEDPDDVWELGWQELGEGSQVVLIEWPERAESLLPQERWEARLSFVDDAPSLRRLALHRVGAAPAIPALPEAAKPAGGARDEAAGIRNGARGIRKDTRGVRGGRGPEEAGS